jgi:hypothetical protein
MEKHSRECLIEASRIIRNPSSLPASPRSIRPFTTPICAAGVAVLRKDGRPDPTIGQALEARSRKEAVTAAAKGTTKETASAGQGERADLCNLHKSDQSDRAARNGVSRRTQIKLDRLARERPDLLQRVKAGELRCHRACIQAGRPHALPRIAQEPRSTPRTARWPPSA